MVRQVDSVWDYSTAVLKKCVELMFSDGRTLVCTPDHRIRTADRRWVEAQHLQVGTDEVAVDAHVHQSVDKVRYRLHRDAKVLPLSRMRLVDRQDVGDRRVYDLSVPSAQGDDTRSFVANGVVVHNCNHFTADVAKRLGLKYPTHINRAAAVGAFFLDNPIKDRQRKVATQHNTTQ